uniref:Uncharacterized protein n=1 Tax=Oryza punctata TaxID=4537 RepID=A0A0E0LNK4_ORYPU
MRFSWPSSPTQPQAPNKNKREASRKGSRRPPASLPAASPAARSLRVLPAGLPPPLPAAASSQPDWEEASIKQFDGASVIQWHGLLVK